MKRFLPNLHALRAFEAAARLGSFKRAAEELNVSPTAISHHIRNLEQRLGVSLFVRKTRKVTLTEAGQSLLVSSGQAFDLLSQGVRQITKKGGGNVVSVGMAPSFSRRWMLPRLQRLNNTFPDVELKLVHVSEDHANDQADIVISWGSSDRQGVDVAPLLDVQGTPVVSRKFAEHHRLPETPADLLKLPLLGHLDHNQWKIWFQNNGVEVPQRSFGTKMDDENLVMRAALDGLGAAIGWMPLINEDLASGDLIRLFDDAIVNKNTYNLHFGRKKNHSAHVQMVAEWLLSEGDVSSARDVN